MIYKVPYDFVLQYLYPLRPHKQKMLGGMGLFVEDKNVLLLREREDHPEFNGVFVATQPEYFDSLTSELHTSNMEFDIDGSYHSWIFISEDLEDFNDIVKKACELIKLADKRIGK